MDIRLPIGILFAAIGALLVVSGLANPDDPKLAAIGFNLGLVWGLVMIGFGVGAVVLSVAGRRRD
jgi:hypothetical protein